MYILNPDKMREVDRYAIEKLGISGIELMKNAAASIFEELKEKCADNITVIAGKGNNGGDALILAGMLADGGYCTRVYTMAPYADMGDSNRGILDSLNKKGIQVSYYDESSDISADIIIDGLLGTGFKGSLEDRYRDAIEKINRADSYIVSADIPSGLDAKSGEVPDTCVKADLTVTFGAAKTGFFQGKGPEVVGRLAVKDIGLPPDAFTIITEKNHYIDETMIAGIIPRRKIDSNKGDFGKTMIAAGSKKMPGAGILCCKAAMKAGAGYVFCRTQKENRAVYCVNIPEAIHADRFDPEKYDSVAIGPGLGVNRGTKKLIKKALNCGKLKLILDADALNSISDLSALKTAKARILITPHPKEMARLLGISVGTVQENRLKVCSDFSVKYNTITLLKGHHTVISDENGNIYVNSTGNSALSKAGTGDVLTGLIAGFSAYMDLFEAALLAAYLHGFCADMYILNRSPFSLTASELIDYLPEALARAGLR